MTSLRALLAASAFAGALAVAGAAQAATTVTVDNLAFSWGTPDGVGTANPTNVHTTGNGTADATINWGTPIPGNGPQSGYNLTVLGTGSWSAPVNPPPSTPEWDIAQFTHFNNVIQVTPQSTSISGVPLTLTADVTVGGVTANYNFNFYVHHDETLNDARPCPYGPSGQTGVNSNGCADQVTFEFLDTSDSFTVDGVEYTLNILGFTQDGVPVNSFLSKEGQDSTATLRAKVTTFVDATTPGVPEPATWAMLIAGFGMVGLATRRRRRNTAVRVES